AIIPAPGAMSSTFTPIRPAAHRAIRGLSPRLAAFLDHRPDCSGELDKSPANPGLAGRSALNGLDLLEPRDFLHQELFHPLLHGHLGHGATFAGAGEPDFD